MISPLPTPGIRYSSFILLAVFLAAGCSNEDRRPAYVGTAACQECHSDVTEAWRGSDHDLAMQVAHDSTVLADFDDATFEYAGTVSTFYRRDGDFMVRTDGPDGALNQFRSAARRLRQVGGDKINRLLASGVSETFLADNRQQSAQ